MSENQTAILSAQRALGLLWVILLSFRSRAATDGEIVIVRELCDRLEAGVVRCQEYNEAVRALVADTREICCRAQTVPERAKIDRIVVEMDRLQLLLREYSSVGRETAARP